MCMSSFITPLHHPSSYRGVGVDMALKHPTNHCPPSHSHLYVPFHPLAWLTSKNTTTTTSSDSSKREKEKEKEKESRCESPRSVLDGSKEPENRKNRVGLGIVVALEEEEEDQANCMITSPLIHCQNLLTAVSPRCSQPPCKKELISNTRHESSPIAIPPSHAAYSTLLHFNHNKADDEEEEEEDEFDDSFLWPAGKEVVEEEEEDEEREKEEEEIRERERRKGFVRSIFSVGSPLVSSAFHNENDDEGEEEEEVNWPVTEELLKACFLCKRSFRDGKDIFMYRGDRAFCSEECRYRQIVVDEYHESKFQGLPLY